MESQLWAGLLRLLRAPRRTRALLLTPTRSAAKPPPNIDEEVTKPPPKTYEELLTAALSANHALNPRHKLAGTILTSLLTPQTQLVNLSPGPIPKSTHTSTYTIGDVTRSPSGTTKTAAALNGCVWYSKLLQAGFDWTVRSVWFIPLDTSLLGEDLFDRHFRMIGTLSTPDSRGIVVYPACEVSVDGFWLQPPFEDVESFMKMCGFDVESITSFAQLVETILPGHEEYMNVMKIAIILPSPRLPLSILDTTSVITYSSNDISSQTTEVEDCIPSDGRTVRFELDTSTLPPHLATHGNEMVVIGNKSCVGCWDAHHAKRMTHRIDVAGVLVVDVFVGVCVDNLEYKYAVVRGDDIVEWESGWNRYLTDSETMRDEWRC